MYQVHRIPAFSDNYLWLLAADEGKCAVVDPGDAGPILAFLEEKSWCLTEILLTHHHADHIGGVSALLTHFPDCKVYGPNSPRFASLANPVSQDQKIKLIATGTELTVLELFGHTRDHIGYVDATNAFVGDTLFSIGCGRLFEGTAAQLFESLEKLKQLPDNSRVYCAHEYTLSNLAFAMAVEPENNGLVKYKAEVEALLAQNLASIPTTIARESRLNPFMRCHEVEIQTAIQRQFNLSYLPSPLDTFTHLRNWKDSF